MVVAPVSAGKIQRGDVLVANFNKGNPQDLGTTIVDWNPDTKRTRTCSSSAQRDWPLAATARCMSRTPSATAWLLSLTPTTSAGQGGEVTKDGFLRRPLAMAMAMAPNGHLLVINGLNGQVVEIDAEAGKQIYAQWIDPNRVQTPPGAGDLFGIAMTPAGDGFYYVEDEVAALSTLSSRGRARRDSRGRKVSPCTTRVPSTTQKEANRIRSRPGKP